ncbi:MAG: carbon-nitrogen hydrolase family protein [Acidobacteriota bacterium]
MTDTADDRTWTVAIAQIAPSYLDLDASLEILESTCRRAVDAGARLIVFGETWLPGYPAWLDHCPGAALWDHAPTQDVFARLRRESLTIDGEACDRIARLAAELNLAITVGANERVDRGPGRGTLYNALLTFDANGRLVRHHRKLVPTYTERLVWGPGDGAGLHAVDLEGVRCSGLVCWEHWMPLARQALHDSGEDVHVAVWPTAHDAHQLASRHYAFEGRCFVLVAGLMMRHGDLPEQLVSQPAAGSAEDWLLRGGSAVIGPDGQYVLEPVFDEERLVVVELDLSHIDRQVMTLDVAGHYGRPDVFELRIDRRRLAREPEPDP